MKTLLALAALLATAGEFRADLVMVQKVEGGGQSGEQTIRIKGDQARADLSPQVSMITDGATGDVVTLAHAQKSFLKIPAAQSRAMLEQMGKLRTETEPPALKPTGKKEKIGEYECEIFTCNLGAVTVTYWIARGFPEYASVLAQMEKFQAAAISPMAKGVMPPMKDFPGMTMKTEMDMGGRKITVVLVSAKEENVDPAIFKVPASYKEAASLPLTFPAPK